eukprot:11264855-Ditylum_brightwellii.AAC.1
MRLTFLPQRETLFFLNIVRRDHLYRCQREWRVRSSTIIAETSPAARFRRVVATAQHGSGIGKKVLVGPDKVVRLARLKGLPASWDQAGTKRQAH